MGIGWDRLETMIKSVDLTEGLEARIADPLWMLSRQRQVGEFTGDDAAQPAAVRVISRTARLASYRPGPRGPAVPLPTNRPLESVVEAMPAPDLGSAGIHAAARATRRLLRSLREQRLEAAVTLLRTQYAMPGAAPADAGEPGRVAAALLHRCSLDVARLAAAGPSDDTATFSSLDATAGAAAAAVVGAWRSWYQAIAPPAEPTWDEQRLEHSFSLAAATASGELVLRAAEHDGGDLDWYTVDISHDKRDLHGLKPAGRLPQKTTVAIPTQLRYPGMPASRWWEFEDGTVHFGDIDAGPADLARLVVAEFATSYADDHFVIPIRVPVGSLTEIESVEVVDTFGGHTSVVSAAMSDFQRVGKARVWRLFELTGDEVSDTHPAPWLFLPPSSPGLSGPAVERVALTRDEGANLAWGIEQLIEGPLGRGIKRSEAWTLPPATVDEPESDLWRYRLEATAPPWWIPFLAERLEPSSEQVRLRRARMQAWTELADGAAGPRSALLDPRKPCWLYEEEVPAGGVRIDRAWQLSRWHDGSVHLWLRRRKRPGRGDPASGVRWDLIG